MICAKQNLPVLQLFLITSLYLRRIFLGFSCHSDDNLHQSKYNWANFILIGAVSRLPPARRTSKKMVLKWTHKQWLNCKNWGNAPSLPFPSFTFFLSHLFSLPCREAAPWKQIGDLGSAESCCSGVRGEAPAANAFYCTLSSKIAPGGTQFKHCA